MNYWLVKSEPTKYSWDQFVKDGKAVWDGVRNHQAKINLSNMSVNDEVLYYHSNEGKEIVGVAKVAGAAYGDPNTPGEPWVVVDLIPSYTLTKPVTLAQLKADEILSDMTLVKQSRLSVCPVKPEEFERIIKLACGSSQKRNEYLRLG